MTTTPTERPTEASLAEQGRAALRVGDRASALRCFSQAVVADPLDEAGWLGLAEAIGDPEQRQYCLQRARDARRASLDASQETGRLAPPTAPGGPADCHAEAQPPRLATACDDATSPIAARLRAAGARSNPTITATAEPAGPRPDSSAAVEPGSSALLAERRGRARRSAPLHRPLPPLVPVLLTDHPVEAASDEGSPTVDDVMRLLIGRTVGEEPRSDPSPLEHHRPRRQSQPGLIAQRLTEPAHAVPRDLHAPHGAAHRARLLGMLLLFGALTVVLLMVLIALGQAPVA